jgi:ABC-type phosphate/phosphonate transport system permease subunit
MARTAVSPHLKASVAKRWVTVLALLAFFLQSLVVQTHIHQPQNLAVKSAVAKASHLPALPKTPDPIDQCRFCQELVHAGVFVTPALTTVTTSLIFVTAVFAAPLAFAGASARAFAWQSRAPPRR